MASLLGRFLLRARLAVRRAVRNAVGRTSDAAVCKSGDACASRRKCMFLVRGLHSKGKHDFVEQLASGCGMSRMLESYRAVSGGYDVGAEQCCGHAPSSPSPVCESASSETAYFSEGDTLFPSQSLDESFRVLRNTEYDNVVVSDNLLHLYDVEPYLDRALAYGVVVYVLRYGDRPRTHHHVTSAMITDAMDSTEDVLGEITFFSINKRTSEA